MSNSDRARFGPAVNWEGYRQRNITEAMKNMDYSPVSGHYTDGESWSWHQTYVESKSMHFHK
jgi:hypothetical protein